MIKKKFRKISHPEMEMSPYLSNFSKEVSKKADQQTHKKFRIICIHCKNITGKPPKKFRKISHPELEISPYEPNFSKQVSQLTD